MYNTQAELLFPADRIPGLRALRGSAWQTLVERVIAGPATALDCVALVLVIARLSACPTCQSDSYRALRGCTRCAGQAICHYRGSDQDLIALFEQTRQEIEKSLGAGPFYC